MKHDYLHKYVGSLLKVPDVLLQITLALSLVRTVTADETNIAVVPLNVLVMRRLRTELFPTRAACKRLLTSVHHHVVLNTSCML